MENLIKSEKAILVFISFNKNDDIDFSMDELRSLCFTAEVDVVGQLIQKAKEITPATLIGSGKLEELKDEVQKSEANLIIFNNELSGSQIRNISDFCGVKVIDRMILILDIFAKRATTNEGKIQVELAQLKYTLPRLSGISGTSGRFGSGGVGMRGPGETKLELDKRIIEKNIQKLENDIKKIKIQRDLQKNQRKLNKNLKKVAIVGYTNSGKSTLLNLLTKANIYADDKLFATLETTSRKLWMESGKQLIISDTVGFIDKLPHEFIDAFASTLDEAKNADLILHVIDLENQNQIDKRRIVVEDVLKKIKANNIPVIIVYNKIDKINEIPQLGKDDIAISAKENIGIDKLKDKMMKYLWEKE